MGKTFESLRETLQQTLDEKQRIEQQYLEDCGRLEQKYSEDCQRIDQNLAELRNMISTYTAELHTLEYTALKVQPDAASEPLKRPQMDYQPPQPLTLSSLTADDVRRIMQENVSKPSDSFSFKLGGNWKIVWYVVGAIFMFTILFFLVSLFEKPKETSHVFPTLVNSAEACGIADRIRERVQERRSTAEPLSVATEEAEETEKAEEMGECGIPCNEAEETEEQGECGVSCNKAAESTDAVKTSQKRETRRQARVLFRSIRR